MHLLMCFKDTPTTYSCEYLQKINPMTSLCKQKCFFFLLKVKIQQDYDQYKVFQIERDDSSLKFKYSLVRMKILVLFYNQQAHKNTILQENM